MRVEFIWFNINCPVKMNTGVSLLSRELKTAGHRTKVLHLNERIGLSFEIERIRKITESFNPEIIALSFGSNHFHYANKLAPILKSLNPNVKIICGGVHTTLKPEEVIKVQGVDFIFIGEGDGLFVKLVNRLERGESIREIKSVWIKGNGKVIKNPMASFPDITNQSLPDYTGIDYRRIIELNRGVYETIATRGCKYNCSFCYNHPLKEICKRYMKPNHSSYLRQRGVENLIAELKFALTEFGDIIKLIQFSDYDIAQNYDWFAQFAKLYRSEIRFPYSANFTLSIIDKKLANLIATSNCIQAKVGIECASERIRKDILKKPFSNNEIERGIRHLRSFNINVRSSIMLGIPTERSSDIMATLQYISSLKIDSVRVCIFYPMQGTRARKYCEEQQLMTGKEYDTFDKYSVLKWDAETSLFIEKVTLIYPFFLNIYLNNQCSGEYQELTQNILKMSRREWEDPLTKVWIKDLSYRLAKKHLWKGIPFYYNPFPDRVDVSFLYKERANQFPNIEVGLR